MSHLPLWIRFLLAADRGASAVARMVSALRDELVLAWVPPARRRQITDALYARQSSYAPGGRTWEQGLFEWEAAALEHPAVPRSGRVLVGGAGGGREMAALRQRGYEVIGFDPCEPLVRSGQARFAPDPGATMLAGSYDDLVRAVRGEPTPLAVALAGATPDLVVLGWGSFSYVASADEGVELLGAIRVLAPSAPVLLSFLRPATVDVAVSETRTRLRRLLSRAGAPSRVEGGIAFTPWAGFYRAVPMEEIGTLAERAGYELAVLRTDWYAHALLVPVIGKPGTVEGDR